MTKHVSFTLVMSLFVAVCGCSHRLKRVDFTRSDFDRGYPSVVGWSGPAEVRLNLGTIEIDKHLAHVVVELTVNGHRGWFMIDSGASKSWIRPQFANELQAKVAQSRIANIGAGAVSPDVAILDRCDFGFAQISQFFFVLGDLCEEANRDLERSKQIVGVIGLDLLVPLSAQIDVRGLTVTFRKPPNQSLEPTTLLGTSAAEQPLVPSRVVAHL